MEKSIKDLRYYKKLPYTLKLDFVTENDGTSYWLAEYVELRGCETEGESEVDAVANLQNLFDEYISMRLEETSPIPEPSIGLEENVALETHASFRFSFGKLPGGLPRTTQHAEGTSYRVSKTGAETKPREYAFAL
jgi:predicted RNase H-like HicB family nuclease